MFDCQYLFKKTLTSLDYFGTFQQRFIQKMLTFTFVHK